MVPEIRGVPAPLFQEEAEGMHQLTKPVAAVAVVDQEEEGDCQAGVLEAAAVGPWRKKENMANFFATRFFIY